MKVYGDIYSGNCYKIKLLMSLLGIKHEWIHIDIKKDESHTKEFLKMNPLGKIPVLEIKKDCYLSESNAILSYLAQGTTFFPENPYKRSKVLQWQFFEQYSHEPYIAVARYIAKYQGLPEERRPEYESKQNGGHKALKCMEQQLQQTRYLTGEQMTIADISLYGYTHVADEGGFDLQEYSAIQRWLADIASLPGYSSMDTNP